MKDIQNDKYCCLFQEGTNLQAIINAIRKKQLDGEIKIVISITVMLML